MPKFAANLSMLWPELDFPERFAAAARAGFEAVECQFPYAYDKNLVAGKLAESGLRQVLHNLPAGDWAAGERGIAILPERIGEFQDGVGKGIEYAVALGSRQLNLLAGIAPAGADPARLRETLIANIRFAAAKLEDAGIRLLIEAVNTADVPGFYVHRTQQTLDLIAASGADNAFIQYDVYHMQRMEGDLAMTIRKYLSRIAHLQLADNPGRHEPGTGEIDYPFLFRWVDEIGYDGWIGCEYQPQATTDAGLDWIRPYLA